MIINSKDKIPTSQAIVILINTILAIGILTLPRTAAEKIHTPDVWITVILGGIIAIVAGIIIVKLSQQFPEKTFYQYSQEIVGKWPGVLISLLIICYFFSSASFQLRTLTGITSFFLLEGTPDWAIIMPFMWISLYLNLGGINAIARIFEIIFPITVLIFLVTSFMSVGIFEFDNLRPVLGLGILPALKGLKTTTTAYTGAEIMLFLLAFMKKPSQAVKVIIIGTTIPIFFYVITVVMVIGAFSIDGVLVRTWPTIDLMRSFEIQGLVFERFESLLLVIWTMQIFATYTICYYAAALGLAQIFNKNVHSFLYGLLPIIYIIAGLPKNINELFELGNMISNGAIILFGIIPFLLLMISKWRKQSYDSKS